MQHEKRKTLKGFSMYILCSHPTTPSLAHADQKPTFDLCEELRLHLKFLANLQLFQINRIIYIIN